MSVHPFLFSVSQSKHLKTFAACCDSIHRLKIKYTDDLVLYAAEAFGYSQSSCETTNEPRPPAPPARRCTSSPRSREALPPGSGLCGGQPAGRLRKALAVACRCLGPALSDRGSSGRTRRSRWGWSHLTARGRWGSSDL